MKKRNFIDRTAPTILFSIISIFSIFIFYYYGSNLNSIKHDSKIVAANNYVLNDDYAHLEVTEITENSLSYEKCNQLALNYYGLKLAIKTTVKIDRSLFLQFNNSTFNATICSSPVYNDFEYTEYLGLPLYLDNSSIRKGPQHGARFACYLPSSIADEMLVRFGLNNYDELLNIEEPFTINVEDEVFTFSINNIYLNNQTEHWNKEEIKYDFYKTFSHYNPNSIFIYGKSVFDKCGKTSLIFDYKPSYEHLNRIVKKVEQISASDLNYVLVKTNGQKMNIGIKVSEQNNVFFQKNQIYLYVLFSLLLVIQALLIVFFEDLRRHLLPSFIIVTSAYALFAVIGEIIKSVNRYSYSSFSFFSSFGFVSTLLYLLVLVFVTILFAKEKEAQNND